MYLTNLYDPSYVYLINSLNISQGFGVGHIDHPGTTVQLLGTIVILIANIFSGRDVVTDVFTQPEFYLSVINTSIYILNSAALFLLGWITYKKTKSIYASIFLQLSPFLSITLFLRITRFAPETLFVFVLMLLATIAIAYIYDLQKTGIRKKYAIAFAIICGFGLATKISFFPILLLPLILLKKISSKILFLLATVTSFLIFILPAISVIHFYQFLNWVKKLVAFSGKYGTGERNFINSSSISSNINAIFLNETLFSISFIIIAIVVFMFLFSKFRKNAMENNSGRILIAVFAAMALHVLVVLKHFEIHYLIPAEMLAVTGLFAATLTLRTILPRISSKVKLSYISIVVVIFFVFQIFQLQKSFAIISEKRDESVKFLEYIENNINRELTVTTYGISGKELALFIGSSYGGFQKNKYFSIMRNSYPDYYFFDKWSKHFGNDEELQSLRAKILLKNRLYVLSDNDSVINDLIAILKKETGKQSISSRKVLANINGETVYEIKIESD